MTAQRNYSIRVRGIAQTQGSKRAFVHRSTGRAVVVESAGAALSAWRQSIAHIGRRAVGDDPPLAGPVGVCLRVGLQRPASAPKRRQTWPIGARSGDVDKLARAVLDALTGIAWGDDAQVVSLVVVKYYAETPELIAQWTPVLA